MRATQGYDAIVAYVDTLSSDTEIQRIPAATHSRLGNPFGHQGLAFDAEIASYQNRHRQYAPKAKRFMQRDPLALVPCPGLGYHIGLNVYDYVTSGPLNRLDPSGMSQCTSDCGPCDDGSAAFCGCVRSCRHGECFSGLAECLRPGVAVGKTAVKCAVGCAPTLFGPGWVLTYKACVAGCGGLGTLAELIVAGVCMDTSQFCGQSANDAHENCLD